MKPPLPNPCGSCPYRKDVPSGIWDKSEYEKLPEYDKPTAEQPTQVFMCHQQDGHLCAGWVAVHDMYHCLAIRLAGAFGRLGGKENVLSIMDYKTYTPLFSSGNEAAEHGLRDLENISDKAIKVQENLLQKKREANAIKALSTRKCRHNLPHWECVACKPSTEKMREMVKNWNG